LGRELPYPDGPRCVQCFIEDIARAEEKKEQKGDDFDF